jgi:phenylpyruvate tautomerase PptA (4-oxalocrotonate tautomerase family)
MPYLRLYLPEVSIAQKRHIAQKLIDLTLRTFRRRRYWDRDQITIQFLPQPQPRQRAECRIEVHCHNLTLVNKRAFAEEVAPLLVRSLHLHVKNRLAWLMGLGADRMPPKVDIDFLELPFDDVISSELEMANTFSSEWDQVA